MATRTPPGEVAANEAARNEILHRRPELKGKSLEAIAGEKAGILKRGVPAVFAAQRPEAQQTLDRRASELVVEVIRAQEVWRVEDMNYSPRGSSFTVAQEFLPVGNSQLQATQACTQTAARPLHIQCPLAGEHQAGNAVVAIAALARLGVPDSAIERGIAAGAPKWMEWYAAFGLTVTLVWLYIEILRLLAKMRRN